MKDPKLLFGLDLSLNHFGLVTLEPTGGQVLSCLYAWPAQKYVKVWLKEGSSEDKVDRWPFEILGMLTPKKEELEQRDNYTARRVEWSSKLIQEHIQTKMCSQNNYILCLEDYAFDSPNSGSTGLTQIAELTGVIKDWIFRSGGAIRMYDPTTVKMFGTGKGAALKLQIVQAAEQAGLKLPSDLLHATKKKKRGVSIDEVDGPGTDLCDAYFLARMLWTELQVRLGKIALTDLSSYVRERIFLRVTKPRPINILAQDFIQKSI